MIKENSKPFLWLKHLEKIYPNGEKAVHDFNLEIEKNEFIVIVGPSGCGKSSTLRMLGGLEDITSGDIFLEGELLNYTPSKDRKMAIVFQSYALYPQMSVFDNIAFPLTIRTFPNRDINEKLLSCHEIKKLIEENEAQKIIELAESIFKYKTKKTKRIEDLAVLFNISINSSKLLYELYTKELNKDISKNSFDLKTRWGKIITEIEQTEHARLKSKDIIINKEFCVLNNDGSEKIIERKLTPYEIKTRVYNTAEKLDLIPYLDKLPKELSGGQMQRVALGRAIIKNVPIFMMDEPLSNLDAKLRLTMRSEIVKLHNRINATTIYVTHDQTEAMTMATRIVVMSKGFIQQVGTPEEIYNQPENIFVAKFIGSPSMNMFEMKLDKNKCAFKTNEFEIPVDKKFIEKYNTFYLKKEQEFTEITKNFNASSREKILKLLSVLVEEETIKTVNTKKKNKRMIFKLIDFIKQIFNKVPEVDSWEYERAIAQSKLQELKDNVTMGQNLIVGIRPERIHIEKVLKGKSYDGAYITEPILFELLGGEYNVYLELFGKSMIARLDARNKLEKGDKVAVKILAEDLFVFDPITGEIIK